MVHQNETEGEEGAEKAEGAGDGESQDREEAIEHKLEELIYAKLLSACSESPAQNDIAHIAAEIVTLANGEAEENKGEGEQTMDTEAPDDCGGDKDYKADAADGDDTEGGDENPAHEDGADAGTD